MFRSGAQLAGRLIAGLLTLFLNSSLAQTATSKADAQVQYVFGIPPWDIAVSLDGAPVSAGPAGGDSGSVNCRRQSFSALFDLYVDSGTCIATYFGLYGLFFRDDLGVDSRQRSTEWILLRI